MYSNSLKASCVRLPFREYVLANIDETKRGKYVAEIHKSHWDSGQFATSCTWHIFQSPGVLSTRKRFPSSGPTSNIHQNFYHIITFNLSNIRNNVRLSLHRDRNHAHSGSHVSNHGTRTRESSASEYRLDHHRLDHCKAWPAATTYSFFCGRSTWRLHRWVQRLYRPCKFITNIQPNTLATYIHTYFRSVKTFHMIHATTPSARTWSHTASKPRYPKAPVQDSPTSLWYILRSNPS